MSSKHISGFWGSIIQITEIFSHFQASEALTIIHITDIHYDPMYAPNGNAECGATMCCRSDQGNPDRQEAAAGYWGDYRHCDIPWQTVQNTLQQIKQSHKVNTSTCKRKLLRNIAAYLNWSDKQQYKALLLKKETLETQNDSKIKTTTTMCHQSLNATVCWKMIFYQCQHLINRDCNPPFQEPSDPELLSFKKCHSKSMHAGIIHCFQATVRHQFQTAVRLLYYNMTADDGSIKVNIYILC